MKVVWLEIICFPNYAIKIKIMVASWKNNNQLVQLVAAASITKSSQEPVNQVASLCKKNYLATKGKNAINLCS